MQDSMSELPATDDEMISILKGLELWEKLRDVIRRKDVLGRIHTGIIGHWFQDEMVKWAKRKGLSVEDVSDKQLPYDLLIEGIPTQCKITSDPIDLNLMRNGHNDRYESDEWIILACKSSHDIEPLLIPVEVLIDQSEPDFLVKTIRFAEFSDCRSDTSVFFSTDRKEQAERLKQKIDRKNLSWQMNGAIEERVSYPLICLPLSV